MALQPPSGIVPTDWRLIEAFDDHEFVIALSDGASGLRAYVAIHNRNLGIAHGGTRMREYESDLDALNDALELSKAMSYKSALAGLNYGGAKGVIIANTITDRQAALRAYALKVEALQGLFHTGTDVGLVDADVRYMAEFSQYMLGVGAHETEGASTSTSAALGVYYAIKTAANFRYGSDNLEGKVIGVKGVGKLGGELVRLLAQDGAQLLIADVDQHTAQLIQQQHPGTRIIDATDIHAQKMDIYAPCALGHEFDETTVQQLQCDIVCGGANNQLESDAIGDRLFQQGILYAPDFVANAGGLIFASEELEPDNFSIERISNRLRHIGEVLHTIFETSKVQNVPTHRVAEMLAQSRISGASL